MARIVEEIVLKVSVNDKSANKKIKAIGNSAKKTEKQVNLLGDALKLVSAGAVILGLKNLGQEAIQLSNDFERVNNVLITTFKTQAAVAEQMEFLSETSNRLGINLLKSAQGYAKLASSAKIAGLSTEDTQKIFEATAEATTALGLTADDTNGILRAFSQIASKGKVQAEELLQISERGIPIQAMMAKALGVTNIELQDMAAKGEILAVDALPKMAQAIKDAFHEGALKNSNSELAKAARRTNTWEGALKDGGSELKVFTSALGDAAVKAWDLWIDVASDAIVLGGELTGTLDSMARGADKSADANKNLAKSLNDVNDAVSDGMTDSFKQVVRVFDELGIAISRSQTADEIRVTLGLTEKGFKKIESAVTKSIKAGIEFNDILEASRQIINTIDLEAGDLIKDEDLKKAEKMKDTLMEGFDFFKGIVEASTFGLFGENLGGFDESSQSQAQAPKAGLELGTAAAAEFLVRPTEDTNKIAKQSLDVNKKILEAQNKGNDIAENQNNFVGK